MRNTKLSTKKKNISYMFSKCFYYTKLTLLECKHSISILIKFAVFYQYQMKVCGSCY